MAYYSVTEGGIEARQRMRAFMTGQLADALRELNSERRHEIADALTELVTLLSVPNSPARMRGTR